MRNVFLRQNENCSFFKNAPLRQPNRNRWRFSMWKLALNVATFAIFNLNYLAFYLFVEYWSAQACKSGMFRNSNPLLLVRGITFAAQKFRIILDPIITYISDTAVNFFNYATKKTTTYFFEKNHFQIRRSLLEMIRYKRNA